MSKPKHDFRFFEGWARSNKMMPVVRVEEQGADILIADSGQCFFGTNDEGVLGRWYRTGFAMDRGDKTWLASYHDYAATDYDLVSRNEGQQQRVNEALEYARLQLNLISKAGLFDGDKGFSQRPN